MITKKIRVLTVDRTGDWRIWTDALPAASTPMGTVKLLNGETGALVREAAGTYALVKAGESVRLDGRNVAAALGTTGRPVELEGGKRINAHLDAESLSVAAEIGGGNVSEGIRLALKREARTQRIKMYPSQNLIDVISHDIEGVEDENAPFDEWFGAHHANALETDGRFEKFCKSQLDSALAALPNLCATGQYQVLAAERSWRDRAERKASIKKLNDRLRLYRALSCDDDNKLEEPDA